MNKLWSDEAWAQYVSWQSEDRKTLKRINALIKDIERNGFSSGIGKPEPLRGEFSGLWSRRIDQTHRLVYEVTEYKGRHVLIIYACKTHYGDH